jgi:hypothetical protein
MPLRTRILTGLLLVATPALSQNLPGLRTTQEGNLYRIATAEAEAAPHRQTYKIVERELDSTEVAERQVDLAISKPTPLREVVKYLLSAEEMSATYSGDKAMAASNMMVGPAVFSGGLKGALNAVASNAGLQVYIRDKQVEFTDRRGYRMLVPSYENLSELARRTQATRAGNVRLAGNAIDFDANTDALRDVQQVLNEVRAGRRGATGFLDRMAQPDVAAMQRKAEADAVKAVTAAAAPQATPGTPPRPVDVMARPVRIEYEGDVTEAVRRLAQAAGVNYRIVRAPTQPMRVSIKAQNLPLRDVLEDIDRQLKGRAGFVYVKASQRLDFAAS